jgi:branched-chain amino acid transport system substrate-binding protein
MKVYAQGLLILLSCLYAVASYSAEPIKIGAIYSKTGEAKFISNDHLTITKFAIDEINRKGGVLGRQIELFEYSNDSTGLGSRNAARQAVQDNVVAVLGPSWSSHALASGKILQKAGIPMIAPTATNPKVTQVGDYIFRGCFIDSYQGEMLARFAREDLKAGRVVILINTGFVYSTYLADVFKTSFEELGGNIVGSFDYVEDTTDFKEMLKQMQQLSYDMVFLPGYARDAAHIIKTAVDMGLVVTFLGSDSWNNKMFDYAGSALEGNYYMTHWDKSLDTEKNRIFVKKITNIFESTRVNAGVAQAYDVTYLLADAITRAGSAEPAAIRAALAATTDFVGVTGKIVYDGNRNPQKTGVVKQFKGGTTIVVKTLHP